MAYQGIGKDNMLNYRIVAADATTNEEDKAIATAFRKRFCIPLDFQLLESHVPFYKAGLGDRLEYELTFNNYNKVIKLTDKAFLYNLEFDMVSDPELTGQIGQQYR